MTTDGRSASAPLPEVTIFTDGGCKGNPGPGGWGAVLLSGGRRLELSGAESETTNNRMELRAAIEALRALKRRCRVTVVTDSEYLRNGITAWVQAWVRNGWRTKDRQPVKNAELWRDLLDAVSGHEVTWRWTKGHANDVENNRCDALANAAIRNTERGVRNAE
ncbi:MAG: Ribonuclease HI [uncultured Thermomicrobiales bacterium]|uniref:Ribonuclease H n=1 Tax=uncultured Thermomicrobiales bacterium TaxID=1645740 RepID=A0A6J4UUE6_9BACT|nr:MAG: Ribonuclease HI [uncultured Thermomicrobiales bacterium]